MLLPPSQLNTWALKFIMFRLVNFMASDIIKKVNSSLKFLYRQSNYFDQRFNKTLCSALILCVFDNSISSWYGGLSETTRTKLQHAQNKVIRFILSRILFTALM